MTNGTNVGHRNHTTETLHNIEILHYAITTPQCNTSIYNENLFHNQAKEPAQMIK